MRPLLFLSLLVLSLISTAQAQMEINARVFLHSAANRDPLYIPQALEFLKSIYKRDCEIDIKISNINLHEPSSIEKIDFERGYAEFLDTANKGHGVDSSWFYETIFKNLSEVYSPLNNTTFDFIYVDQVYIWTNGQEAGGIAFNFDVAATCDQEDVDLSLYPPEVLNIIERLRNVSVAKISYTSLGVTTPAHELGHVLGLPHTCEDPEPMINLMDIDLHKKILNDGDLERVYLSQAQCDKLKNNFNNLN